MHLMLNAACMCRKFLSAFLFIQVKLSVEVPDAVCEDCYKRVLNELMKRAKVLLHFDYQFINC